MARINIFNRREPSQAQGQGSVPEPPSAGRSASFGGDAVGIYNETTALKVASFYRACEVRATTMSQLRWEFQTYDRSGRNYVKANRVELARRINYLLQVRPNEMMSACDMQKQAELDIIFRGNAVIYIERDESLDPASFWLCTSASLNPMSNTYDIMFDSMVGPVCYSGVPASDIIHVRNTYTQGLSGLPTLAYARQALSISATNDAQTLDIAAKGGKMKLLVQEDKNANFGFGRASKEQLEKVTAKLNEDIYSSDVVLLTNIAGVTPISQNAQQMELLESRKFSVADIARFMAVPLPMLQDYSNSSYKTPEASTQEFLSRTIAPKIRQWEDEFNAKLLTPGTFGTYRYHLCELPLLRMDMRQQAEIDKMHLETGVKTVNELRAQYDLPAVENGDRHYISTNLAELGSYKLNGDEKGGQQ